MWLDQSGQREENVEAQVKAVMKANPSLVYHGKAPYFTLNEMRSRWWVLSRVYILP